MLVFLKLFSVILPKRRSEFRFVFHQSSLHFSLTSKYISNRRISFSCCKSKNMDFEREKEKYLKCSLHERRSEYACKSNFVTLEKIPPWSKYSLNLKHTDEESVYKKSENLNKRVSVFKGDITSLEIDAIVNAANSTLRGGGGVDGAIHKAAGSTLLKECITLNGCEAGDAKITGGYKLPAKYVIHTVGPMGEHPDVLQSCYLKCLTLAKENDVKSIAFPCISTGIYGYPNKAACHVALKTVREFLEENHSCFERIIFCLFLPVDVGLYEKYLPLYFPA